MAMAQFNSYEVYQSSTIVDLKHQVSLALQNGWQISGNLIAVNLGAGIMFYQPMIR